MIVVADASPLVALAICDVSPEVYEEVTVRWDDPAFKIEWPKDERIISKKDLQYSYFH
jgi:dTDP-4-dehydrorhamnose 3,5-epimerase-like enzyme